MNDLMKKTIFITCAIALNELVSGRGQQLPTTVQFSAPAYSIAEDAGTALISVIRRGDTNNLVTVRYTSSDGTAVAGKNYLAQSGTLTFAAGETSKTVSITILDDGLVEGSTTVKIMLN